MEDHYSSSAASTQSDGSGQLPESSGEVNEGKKRKARKPKTLNYEVVQLLENPRKKRYTLKLAKPSSIIDVKTCPTVILHEESKVDGHAFHVMLNLNNRNLLSLEVIAENKQNKDLLPIAAFVEQYDRTLLSICGRDDCADSIGHIPSPHFQTYVRGIVIGLHYLMKNNLYHGNLSWDSTLYHSGTVKLAGFKEKESMDVEEAQWNDWSCFINMLEFISRRAHEHNQSIESSSSLSNHSKCFCGTIDSFISMMKRLNRTSLPLMKDIILNDPFFLEFRKEIKLFFWYCFIEDK